MVKNRNIKKSKKNKRKTGGEIDYKKLRESSVECNEDLKEQVNRLIDEYELLNKKNSFLLSLDNNDTYNLWTPEMWYEATKFIGLNLSDLDKLETDILEYSKSTDETQLFRDVEGNIYKMDLDNKKVLINDFYKVNDKIIKDNEEYQIESITPEGYRILDENGNPFLLKINEIYPSVTCKNCPPTKYEEGCVWRLPHDSWDVGSKRGICADSVYQLIEAKNINPEYKEKIKIEKENKIKKLKLIFEKCYNIVVSFIPCKLNDKLPVDNVNWISENNNNLKINIVYQRLISNLYLGQYKNIITEKLKSILDGYSIDVKITYSKGMVKIDIDISININKSFDGYQRYEELIKKGNEIKEKIKEFQGKMVTHDNLNVSNDLYVINGEYFLIKEEDHRRIYRKNRLNKGIIYIPETEKYYFVDIVGMLLPDEEFLKSLDDRKESFKIINGHIEFLNINKINIEIEDIVNIQEIYDNWYKKKQSWCRYLRDSGKNTIQKLDISRIRNINLIKLDKIYLFSFYKKVLDCNWEDEKDISKIEWYRRIEKDMINNYDNYQSNIYVNFQNNKQYNGIYNFNNKGKYSKMNERMIQRLREQTLMIGGNFLSELKEKQNIQNIKTTDENLPYKPLALSINYIIVNKEQIPKKLMDNLDDAIKQEIKQKIEQNYWILLQEKTEGIRKKYELIGIFNSNQNILDINKLEKIEQGVIDIDIIPIDNYLLKDKDIIELYNYNKENNYNEDKMIPYGYGLYNC